jgi:type II secretory pathway component GspD/PulD (secretin)
LEFDFTEKTFDSTIDVEGTTTENIIKSQLTIQPGQVIVMAGLFKQSNNVTAKGLPGLSRFSMSGILGTITGLLGGSNVKTSTDSELLVFINPTVITNLNIDKTLKRIE